MKKFYKLFQNNSGGYYVMNEDVQENVIIEAETVCDLVEKFYELDSGIEDWCSCCGERWNVDWIDEEDGFNTLEEAIDSMYDWAPSAIVHLLDGSKYKYNKESR